MQFECLDNSIPFISLLLLLMISKSYTYSTNSYNCSAGFMNDICFHTNLPLLHPPHHINSDDKVLADPHNVHFNWRNPFSFAQRTSNKNKSAPTKNDFLPPCWDNTKITIILSVHKFPNYLIFGMAHFALPTKWLQRKNKTTVLTIDDNLIVSSAIHTPHTNRYYGNNMVT